MNSIKTARLAVAGLVALAAALPLGSQAPPAAPPAAAPSFEERLAARAAANRQAVSFHGGTFSGPGWEWLVKEGRASQFFLVGEEHGIAEVPAVVGELFRALRPAGYRHLAIEISPPMADALERQLRSGGLPGLQTFYRENPMPVAFYTLKEEAGLLAALTAATPGDALWGLDYEVLGDRHLLDRLRRKAPAGPAQAAAEALHDKAQAAWKTALESKNPAGLFAFGNPPELFDELRRAWPHPDGESAKAIELLRETLAINRLFVDGHNWESNDRRARLVRRQFLRRFHAAEAREKTPRVLFKFGGNHMLRGRNVTEVFDLGSLTAEIAEDRGTAAFRLLVVGGAGTEHADLDPSVMQYAPAPVEITAQKELEPIFRQTLPEGLTLFDLRALRPLFTGARAKTTDPELMRLVHGYDAILVLTGSHPSRALP